MAVRALPPGAAALFIAMPTVGLLFFYVPWEIDPRLEPPAKRYERLSNPRRAWVVDALVNAPSYLGTWDGLFPWQRTELEQLRKSAQETPVPDGR